MNVKEKELPTLRIADTRGDYLKKYKMEGELSEDNILKFIDNWENKRLKSYIKSQEVPEKNNEDVLVVVGKTFEKEVINNDKDVMVLFYSPLCYHLYYDCKDIIAKYTEVAKILKRFNSKLIQPKLMQVKMKLNLFKFQDLLSLNFSLVNRKIKLQLIMKEIIQ